MVVSETAAGPVGERREPTTTLSGWRHFVDAAPATFDLLAEDAWAALAAHDKEAYDEARIDYHSELVVVATSTLRKVTQQGRLLTLLNRREISARRGLIVSGPWATGKSTALKQLGRTYELMARQPHLDRSLPYQQEWKGLVATMEAALRLHRHQPGSLAKMDRYLHHRTGGMIGSLSHLIRAGAISAIVDGREAVTRDLLEEIPLDHAAQALRDGAA